MELLSSEEKGLVLRRSKLVGIPSEISEPVVCLFIKWADASGIEWAIQRFKAIKVDFLRKKSGLPKSSQWIKGSNSAKFFGGPIGSLESWAFGGPRRFGKAISLLNLYTGFFARRVTPSQAKKFTDGVKSNPDFSLPPELKSDLDFGILLSGLTPVRKLPAFRPLVTFQASPSKRAPTPWGSVPEEEGVVDSLGYLSKGAGLRHYLDFSEFYRPILRGLEPETDWMVCDYSALGMRSNPLPEKGCLEVGRIGLIQEAGYKLRAVANPGRIFQRVLEPLGKVLFGMLRILPWDCTFDQYKADHAILDRLAHGKSVHSVDLTGATDYFPLALQEQVLRNLFFEFDNYISLFLEVCRGEWKVPGRELSEYVTSRRTISWTKGQPLGLFPSFASFALTHGLLLLGLCGTNYDGQFFILGDDVAILDDELYRKYRRALALLECPVSESKTLSSTKLAEFRSVIYTDGEIIPQFKWRRLSDDSFIDVIRNNPNLVPLLLPRQRKVVELIKGLPVELGGLGWNSEGLSLEDRLRPFWPVLLGDYVPKDRLMGYNSLTRRLLYSSKISQLSSSLAFHNVSDAFDQKAMAYVQDLLGGEFVPLYEILGRNLDKVVDGNIDLPLLGTDSLSKASRLQRWESTLSDLHLL